MSPAFFGLRAAMVAASLFVASCGSGTPTAPSPPPPVVVSPLPPASAIVQINVIGDRFLLTPRPATQMIARISLGLAAGFIDDTDHVSWVAEPTTVATIDRQGRVSAVSPGEAVVSASVGEKVGRTRIRVLPDYSGTWTGEYRIFTCSGAADPRTCPRNMFDESTGLPIFHPFSVVLTQSADRVTGTGFTSKIPITGLVRVSGVLVLEGPLEQSPVDPLRLTNWSSMVNLSATEMSGGFTLVAPYILSLGGQRGILRTESEFTRMTRVP